MTTNSATSTERERPARDLGIQPWQFYLLLSMGGATWAVIVSRNTQPTSLLLLSGAVMAAGFVGLAVHTAIAGFLGARPAGETSLAAPARDELEREKALVLRSLKELEFDRGMGKVGDDDFAQISAQLRARALVLMQDLERTVLQERQTPPSDLRESAPLLCPSCAKPTDADAQFCKFCGARVA